MYPFEWFWQNAQCISQNRSGERTHQLLSQNVTYGSELDKFDSWTSLVAYCIEVECLLSQYKPNCRCAAPHVLQLHSPLTLTLEERYCIYLHIDSMSSIWSYIKK